MGAVDPLRALDARPVRVEDSRCGICNAPARWWTDGWLECPRCDRIYDPKDYAETMELREREEERRRAENHES